MARSFFQRRDVAGGGTPESRGDMSASLGAAECDEHAGSMAVIAADHEGMAGRDSSADTQRLRPEERIVSSTQPRLAEQLDGDPGPLGKWRRRSSIGVGLVVMLGIGVAIGVVAHSTGVSQARFRASRAQASSLKSQVAVLKSHLSGLQAQVITDNSALTTARKRAASAQKTANANAAAAYKARETSLQATYQAKQASLGSQERTVASEQNTLKQELGEVQANTISASGVYVVGRDIKSGTWHTTGDGGQGGNSCYYATLGSTDTSNIIDNNSFDGPETVDMNGAYALEINGSCTWQLIPGS